MAPMHKTHQKRTMAEPAIKTIFSQRVPFSAAASLSLSTWPGINSFAVRTMKGRTTMSSTSPKSGMVSGIRSTGLIRYSAPTRRIAFTVLGVAGFFAEISIIIMSLLNILKNISNLLIFLTSSHNYTPLYFNIFIPHNKIKPLKYT